ncbi:MAG: hypothetical protein AB7N80_02990 [Bdellovibrionales bacterium]
MKRLLIISLLLLASPLSWANDPRPPSPRSQMAAPPPSEANWWFGPRLVFWQEKIPAKRTTNEADFYAQSVGLMMSAARRGKFGNSKRWYHSLGFEAAFGTVQASSLNIFFPDYLKDQPWFSAGLNPGIVYRGTAVTDIYLSIPAHFRKIMWSLKDPNFSIERESSFSAGLSLLSASRISHSTTIVAGFVHQYQWNATQWVFGFDYDF